VQSAGQKADPLSSLAALATPLCTAAPTPDPGRGFAELLVDGAVVDRTCALAPRESDCVVERVSSGAEPTI
jgi:hypothetical protein